LPTKVTSLARFSDANQFTFARLSQASRKASFALVRVRSTLLSNRLSSLVVALHFPIMPYWNLSLGTHPKCFFQTWAIRIGRPGIGSLSDSI